MAVPSTQEITQLLVAWNNREAAALEHLATLDQAEPHRLAKRHIAGERRRHILPTTALDDALQTVEKLDPRQARVVELCFFAGLSMEETAEALKASLNAVRRDWSLAEAWLFRELNRKDPHDDI